jgi:hypothetical protein
MATAVSWSIPFSRYSRIVLANTCSCGSTTPRSSASTGRVTVITVAAAEPVGESDMAGPHLGRYSSLHEVAAAPALTILSISSAP